MPQDKQMLLPEVECEIGDITPPILSQSFLNGQRENTAY